MTYLVIGLAIFFAVHSVAIVAPAWRTSMIAKLGDGPWKGLYSLASLVGFGLIIWGYGEARLEPTVLYVPPVWMRHAALLLLLPVFPLLLATYLRGHISRTVKHPTLIATKLWAVAHLLANGMAADVALFGVFLIWAAVALSSAKRRAPGSGAPGLSESVINDVIAVVAGLGIYVAFAFWIHVWLIGVPPVAM